MGLNKWEDFNRCPCHSCKIEFTCITARCLVATMEQREDYDPSVNYCLQCTIGKGFCKTFQYKGLTGDMEKDARYFRSLRR